MKPILFTPEFFAVAIVTAGVSLFAYNELPEQVPIHFNQNGEPDQWIGKSPLWFLIPTISLWEMLYRYGALEKMREEPSLIEVPYRGLFWSVTQREMFLSMTPQQREPIFIEVERWRPMILIDTIYSIVSLFVFGWVILNEKDPVTFLMPYAIPFSVPWVMVFIVMRRKISALIKASAQR